MTSQCEMALDTSSSSLNRSNVTTGFLLTLDDQCRQKAFVILPSALALLSSVQLLTLQCNSWHSITDHSPYLRTVCIQICNEHHILISQWVLVRGGVSNSLGQLKTVQKIQINTVGPGMTVDLAEDLNVTALCLTAFKEIEMCSQIRISSEQPFKILAMK